MISVLIDYYFIISFIPANLVPYKPSITEIIKLTTENVYLTSMD